MEYRNPILMPNGQINCEINHPQFGWIPFTCCPNDTGAQFDTAALHEAMTPHVVPYVPPVVDLEQVRNEWRATRSISRREFCINAFNMGILTSGEAVVAAKGDWPPSFNDAVSDLDEDEKALLEIEWAAVSYIDRNHPGIIKVASSIGLLPEQVDALFGWTD